MEFLRRRLQEHDLGPTLVGVDIPQSNHPLLCPATLLFPTRLGRYGRGAEDRARGRATQ